MADWSDMPFGQLLRQLRTDAGLTQEELAQAAGVSPRSVSDLERGINATARRDTARLLADALGLTGPARAAFEAVGRGRPPAGRLPAGGVAAARTLPRDIASFTGRAAELGELVDASRTAASGGVVGIYAIGGMAGIGKTTFAVHAAHRLAPRFPDGQIFLELHAHTPGQRPVDPADALASLLLTAGVGAQHIPPGLDARMRLWRDQSAGKRLLLVLDDATGHEQVRPLLPGSAESLVLITSRRHLTALEDAQPISLDILSADEAAELLIRLAARPGLSSADAAVGNITRLCGYLPLAIGMLARQLHHHPAWSAAGLAADLREAHDRLGLMRAENLSVTAAFDLSYRDLTGDQQMLFRRLGLHPGSDIDSYAAAALGDTDLSTVSGHLDALYDQYLIAEPARGRYRLHDLIRAHASALAAADQPAERAAALGRLLDYYLHTANSADRYLARRTRAGPHAVTGNPPAHAPDLASRDDAVTWMDAERLSLHAAASYAATHDRSGHGAAIAAAMHGFLRTHGPWDQALSLHRTAADATCLPTDPIAHAGALTDLGHMQYLTGDHPAAVANLARALDLYGSSGDQLGEANVLNYLGTVRYVTGDFPAAAASLTRAVELYRHRSDKLGEANALHHLGSVQEATGDYRAALACLARALELYRDRGDQIGEATALSDLGAVQHVTGDYLAAAAALTRAIDLHRRLGDRNGQADALGRLGPVQLATGDYRAAAVTLTQALELHHRLSNRQGEAHVLSRLGAVQQASGDYPAAGAALTRALQLHRRFGNRNGEAVALNHQGELALASSRPHDARVCHEQALAIALSIASPLEEARALEGIGRCHLQDGLPNEGGAALRQALAIYQRVGLPGAERVQETLTQHGL